MHTINNKEFEPKGFSIARMWLDKQMFFQVYCYTAEMVAMYSGLLYICDRTKVLPRSFRVLLLNLSWFCYFDKPLHYVYGLYRRHGMVRQRWGKLTMRSHEFCPSKPLCVHQVVNQWAEECAYMSYKGVKWQCNNSRFLPFKVHVWNKNLPVPNL